jgi:hypothetical protein
VLKNKFEEIGPFGRRVAIVKLNGKFGFIDEMGKIIVKPIYQKAIMVSGFGFVFDEKEKGWKMVGSFGLDSPYTYSDIQGLPFGCVLVNQRFKWFTHSSNRYVRAIRWSHKMHHKHLGKEDGESFGFLIIGKKYWDKIRRDDELRKASKRN